MTHNFSKNPMSRRRCSNPSSISFSWVAIRRGGVRAETGCSHHLRGRHPDTLSCVMPPMAGRGPHTQRGAGPQPVWGHASGPKPLLKQGPFRSAPKIICGSRLGPAAGLLCVRMAYMAAAPRGQVWMHSWITLWKSSENWIWLQEQSTQQLKMFPTQEEYLPGIHIFPLLNARTSIGWDTLSNIH